MNVVTLLFGTLGLMLLLGAPITLALGVASMSALYFLDIDLVYLVQVAYTSVDSFPIMALPAFILAGALMEYAGISRRLVNVAEALAGPATGGLASATVLACLFFGAISGSGPATTAAVGMLMIPAMIAYFMLRARLDNRMMATAQEAGRLLDQLADDTTDSVEPE